jgi:hypothetical protein
LGQVNQQPELVPVLWLGDGLPRESPAEGVWVWVNPYTLSGEDF